MDVFENTLDSALDGVDAFHGSPLADGLLGPHLWQGRAYGTLCNLLADISLCIIFFE
jgi:hypothetical protein